MSLKRYSPEEDKEILYGVHEGTPFVDIAHRLGRSAESVYDRWRWIVNPSRREYIKSQNAKYKVQARRAQWETRA